MTGATISYSVPMPYYKALRAVRSSLKREKLEIWMDRDIGKTIRRSLSIGLDRAKVLGVVCPVTLLRIAVAGAAALSILPLHIVINEHDGETHVHLLNSARLAAGEPNAPAFRLDEFVARVQACLEATGARRMSPPSPN